MDYRKVSTETPNPGSDAALELGCQCPILDNNHGHGWGASLFWITEDCPLHGRKREEDEQ